MAYRDYVKKVAKELPVLLDSWEREEAWKAFKAVVWALTALLLRLLLLLTLPISIWPLAWGYMKSDEHDARRAEQARQRLINRLNPNFQDRPK